jgi:2-C-methyl-D-erythritol 2,4-cyclodiphosphate synthase
MNFRIGVGFDVHRLAEGERLVLGGIPIDHYKGTVGHSDADVLIHAICDALLGAAGLKDIGYYFPDTDAEWKNADSKLLLQKVVGLIGDKGYKVGNIDSSLCLEKPKIKPHIDSMNKVLASILKVEPDAVGIKATTNENLGFIGREEGVTAYAVALIYK